MSNRFNKEKYQRKPCKHSHILETCFTLGFSATYMMEMGVAREICQLEALVSVNNHTEVLRSHCIGCGNCLNVCSSEAITLMKKEKVTVPPRDRDDLYNKMTMERYGVLGALKIMGKTALGKKF